MTSAFDYISPKNFRSPKRKPKKTSKKSSSIIKVYRSAKSPPKSSKKSPPKSSKKSAPKSAPKRSTPKSTPKRSTTRSTSRTSRTSYKKKTAAKKHGSMRSYLKGKDMFSKLTPVIESPTKQGIPQKHISPESKRLRRLGFYGELPRTPKIRKSKR